MYKFSYLLTYYIFISSKYFCTLKCQRLNKASNSTMKAAKMKPWGIAPRCPSSSISSASTDRVDRVWWPRGSKVSMYWGWGSDGVRAGVHSRTKVYIEPSNNDWIMPRHSTFRSVQLESDRSFVSVIEDRQNFPTSAIGACRLPITDYEKR